MNSPIWVRKNIGKASKKPGLPYPDPMAFKKWVEKTIGKPSQVDSVILIGMTTDCCVLCTAQQLSFMGYKIRILKEATDTYSGKQSEKNHILTRRPLTNWAKAITWKELKPKL